VWDVAEAAGLVGDLQVDVVVEASGSGSATELGLAVVAPGGTFVVVGAGAGNSLDPAKILFKEVVVRGSFTYTDEFDAAIDLLADGAVVVDDLAPVVVPIGDALAAFELLRDAATMKVLIDPRG
jgi:threonine dehydrogenase-like Zn-dependent dehydrogenase